MSDGHDPPRDDRRAGAVPPGLGAADALPAATLEFLKDVGALGAALLRVLGALERTARHLHPPQLPRLRAALVDPARQLDAVYAAFSERPVPSELSPLAERLEAATSHARRAVDLFAAEDAGPEAVVRVLRAMHFHCRAQEALFVLADLLPPVHRFFLEPGADAPTRDGSAPQGTAGGLLSASNGEHDRGGFSLYVPPGPPRARPLVVALHGGHGHGADFIWTWLREARSRDLLLLSPTSLGDTWSFDGGDVDGPSIREMIGFVGTKFEVDTSRILLTGLSDGATYTLFTGLAAEAPFTALAPVSGVFHPANLVNGNLERARGCRIRLIHGALDWMFPVNLAREAHHILEAAGALIEYVEIGDLSHAYPREENAQILDWFLAD